MAKAALEAMNGLNLFGSQGSSLSIIHVDPDAQYRNCVILNNLLPRESSSKETDASLLMISGYPAFSIDDTALRQRTEERTKQLLGVSTIIVQYLYSTYVCTLYNNIYTCIIIVLKYSYILYVHVHFRLNL